MKRLHFFFRCFYWLFTLTFWVYHPYKLYGREKLPEGPAVLCANHSGFADPLWVFMAMNAPLPPWTMAKKSVMDKPVLGKFLAYFRAFPVDRENADLGAIRKSLSVLKDGDKLLIFPEGTRVKKGMASEPKSGTMLIASRANVPVVPIYITHQRRPFQKVKVVIGDPYQPEFASRKPSSEELEAATAELMEKIYGMA